MAETNVEIARRGHEAAVKGDLDAVRDFLDPEIKWHGGELVDVVDAGDKVILVLRSPSEGSASAPLVANLTTFRDAKAIEMVHYPNPEDALAAAGL